MALPHLDKVLEFAIQTAHEAGRLTLGYFQTEMKPDMKADDTPVTLADRKAEELIRARIEKCFPGHRIVGEEFGSQGSDASAPCWWIDPIDGTKAFIRGVPLYGVLMGAAFLDEPLTLAHFIFGGLILAGGLWATLFRRR